MAIEFSDRQRTTIAAAVTILSAVVILIAIGALFWIVGAFFVKFSAVFLPLAVAMVAALVVKPFYELISTRLKLGRVPALIVVFLSFIVPVAALAWFFGDLLVDQVKGLIDGVPRPGGRHPSNGSVHARLSSSSFTTRPPLARRSAMPSKGKARLSSTSPSIWVGAW